MIVDLSKNYQSYFKAYLIANGIKTGDEVKFCEYSAWISDKHAEFRKLKGCPYCNGFPPEVRAEFERFIGGEPK